jgi:hypothetical protein
MKIRQGKLEEFRRHAGVIIAQAKAKDPGTPQYDWFVSSDKTECEVREAYESSEALLAHTVNMRELIGILFEKYATDHSIVIYGDPSPEILQKAAAMGVGVRVYSFLQGLT